MNYRKENNFKISADVYSYISEPKWSREANQNRNSRLFAKQESDNVSSIVLEKISKNVYKIYLKNIFLSSVYTRMPKYI